MHIMLDMHMHAMHCTGMKLDLYLSDNKVTEEAFAQLVGVTQPQVNKWRRGVSLPSVGTAAKIEQETRGLVSLADWAVAERVA